MKRGWKVTIALACALGVSAGGYTAYLYQSVKNTVSSIYEPVRSVAGGTGDRAEAAASNEPITIKTAGTAGSVPEADAQGVDLSQKQPFTLLVMGVDEREHDTGRSDSIIVLGVNPAKHSVLMFNIPRDSRTEIVGHGTVDKINHAYAFGGVQMAVNTVENFLGVPMDYYIKVNMEGFENIINILGGVEVNNPFAFKYEGRTYEQGPLSLNGHDALMYSRMRYDDPKGDLGRNARQQAVLSSLIDQAKNISSVTKIPEILDQIKGSTKTNLTMDDIMDIFTNYRQDIEKVDKDEVQGSGEMINHIYYYKVSDKEKLRIRSKLLEQLK
ncbi:LCP family protein [Paenibacillus sp. JX-17]|uniref:LCP family protein n=1 Tax=Paenibacillus lacisoli TaxID=3064525 RepID=A0ABT9CGH9_9BACL|nr:LCP family protein [Paenibacillus sp. JX-17]MDO7908388.1 LCP family protein [Paenibacillus sp. JX-17]